MAEANGGEMLFTIVRRSSCDEADPIETAHLLLEDFDGTDIDHEALTYLHQNEGSIDAVQQQGFDLNNEMQQTLLNAAEIEHCTENHLEQLKDSGMLDEIPQDIELKQNLSGEDERHRYSNVKDIGIDMNNSTHIYFRHCIVDKIKCTENNSSCYKRNESYKGTYQQEEVIKDRVLNTEISTEENKTVTFYEEKNSGDDQSNDLYMDMVNEIGQSSPRKEEKWSAASSSICSLCLSHRKYEFESSSSDTEMLSNGKYVRQICICPKNLPNFTHKSLPLHYVSDMHEDRDEYLHKDKILLEKNNAIKDTYVPRADSFTVDILPDEVMFKIFSFFSPTELCRYIAPVCRKWLHYARDPTLWTYISYDEFRDVQSELFAKVLTSWCTLVKDIDFRCRNDLDGRDFKAIFMNCPLLEKVSFAFCSQLDHKILQQLSKYCKHVHSVNMEGTQINDSSLMYLVGLPIKSINVSHCNYLSDEGLTFMAMNFCGLEEVNFDGIQWITQDSIQVLVDNCSDSLTGISFDGADLTDDTTRLLSRCQKTRKLTLSFCDTLTDGSLTWVSSMKNLEHLELKKGVNFTNIAILNLIKELHFSRSQHQTGLRYLSLAECSSLSDESMYAISESCPHLEVINLSWCWEVTDDGIDFIFDSCHKLTEFHLCGLHELYGAPFIRVPKEMPKLKFLDLRHCNKVSDDLLADLSNRIKTLKILNYYGEEVNGSLSFWNYECAVPKSF